METNTNFRTAVILLLATQVFLSFLMVDHLNDREEREEYRNVPTPRPCYDCCYQSYHTAEDEHQGDDEGQEEHEEQREEEH